MRRLVEVSGFVFIVVLGLLALVRCVGKPTICATTWEVHTGVEQSYATGRPRPTGEVSVGGELGSDRCKESKDD